MLIERTHELLAHESTRGLVSQTYNHIIVTRVGDDLRLHQTQLQSPH